MFYGVLSQKKGLTCHNCVNWRTGVFSLQIPCKIIHIQSGHEVGSKFQELMSHFEKFGSPVMIGKVS